MGAMSRRTSRRPATPTGFTLVEVLVVMTILVILAGTGLALYGNGVTRAKEAALKEDLVKMRDAIDQHYADKGTYPGSLDVLVDARYLRSVPIDPFTRSTETWQTVLSEPEAGNPSAEIGVFDVKSGSDRQSIDGSRYAEW